MKKSAVLLFTMLFITTSILLAQQKEPQMSFEKRKHNFGTVDQKKGNVETTFTFTNTGAEPIIITEVKSSCGCTTPSWSKKPIVPGATGFVTAIFNPANRPGHFNKTITVKSNAKNSPVTLTINGNVTEKISTEEETYPHQIGSLRLNSVYANFAAIFDDQTKTKEIKIYNPTKSEMKIAFEQNRIPAYLKIDIKPETLEPLGKGIITFTYDGSKVNDYDYVRSILYLNINGEKIRDKRINVSAIVKEKFTEKEKENPPVIEFDNTEFDFGTITKGTKVNYEFTFKNTGKNDLIIRKTRASCGCTAVNVTKEPIPPGGTGSIKVTFDSTHKQGKQNKTVTVITNCPNPKQNKVLLRIKGTVVTKEQ